MSIKIIQNKNKYSVFRKYISTEWVTLNYNVFTFQQTMATCIVPSDSHKLVLLELKTTVPRSQLKEITFRDCKQLDSSKLETELKKVLTKENVDSFTKFDKQFLKVLKRKLLRANHASCISKSL